jgi:hypothetical protein
VTFTFFVRIAQLRARSKRCNARSRAIAVKARLFSLEICICVARVSSGIAIAIETIRGCHDEAARVAVNKNAQPHAVIR